MTREEYDGEALRERREMLHLSRNIEHNELRAHVFILEPSDPHSTTFMALRRPADSILAYFF